MLVSYTLCIIVSKEFRYINRIPVVQLIQKGNEDVFFFIHCNLSMYVTIMADCQNRSVVVTFGWRESMSGVKMTFGLVDGDIVYDWWMFKQNCSWNRITNNISGIVLNRIIYDYDAMSVAESDSTWFSNRCTWAKKNVKGKCWSVIRSTCRETHTTSFQLYHLPV